MILSRGAKGFTLTELLIVIIIMGMLAALVIPSYMKTVEAQRAEDAVATLNMIGTTNRMYALDHSGTYISEDTFPASSCTTEGLPACPTGGAAQTNACVLVACKYLADTDWNGKHYEFRTCNGTAGTLCAANALAHAKRKSGTYANWAYRMSQNGVITSVNSAPDPTY